MITAGPPGRERLAAWTGIVVGVAAVSVSAPLTSVTVAPALALAFWRAGSGAVALVPWLALRRPRELARAPAATRRWAGAAGVMLAVHFATWFPALRLTSVAAATALVATTPVWTVLLRWLRGEPSTVSVMFGVGLAVLGVLAITGVDVGRSGRAALGDLLALAGGIAGAGYVDFGERARRGLSPSAYSVVACAVCAVVMWPVCLLVGARLTGYQAGTWAQIAVIVVVAQLIGHGSLNAALPKVGATALSLALLFEVPGAVLVSWAWYGQAPPGALIPGTLLLLIGLAVVVT